MIEIIPFIGVIYSQLSGNTVLPRKLGFCRRYIQLSGNTVLPRELGRYSQLSENSVLSKEQIVVTLIESIPFYRRFSKPL